MRILNIAILTSLLVIVGCVDPGYTDWDPYKGSRGLEISFLENAPPYEIYENQQFPIGINLKNSGAYDITQGVLSIGVENDYMVTPSGDDQTFLLAGRSINNPHGEEETKIFYSQTKPLDRLSMIHRSDILVTACYAYENKLRTEVCIDPDIFNLGGVKPCNVGDQSFSGQGGPLGVTYIKETLTLNKNNEDKIIPVFEITIENLGDGEVIDSYAITDYCSSKVVHKDKFNVFYMDVYIGDDKMECTPENPMRLKSSGDAKVICTLPEGLNAGDVAYTSVLSADFYYGYTATISEEVIINGLPK